jgi:hypothetical protein
MPPTVPLSDTSVSPDTTLPGLAMDRRTQTHLSRLDLYLSRVKAGMARGDYIQALADCAELAEISRRCWLHIEALLKAEQR